MTIDLSRFKTKPHDVVTLDTGVPAKKRRTNKPPPHIGCPVEWLKRVIPIVKTKEQLAIALWLYRRQNVCKTEWFATPNELLRLELGLSRKTKYVTLQRLEKAGAIVLRCDNKRSLEVKMLW